MPGRRSGQAPEARCHGTAYTDCGDVGLLGTMAKAQIQKLSFNGWKNSGSPAYAWSSGSPYLTKTDSVTCDGEGTDTWDVDATVRDSLDRTKFSDGPNNEETC